MENTTKIGMNRTGMQMAPIQGPTQAAYAEAEGPAPADAVALARERSACAAEAGRLGSVPPPGTGRGLLHTAADKLKGHNPEVLLDKLGQRLAYERSGVRLYDAVLAKVQVWDHAGQDALRNDLLTIREEEAAHFQLLAGVVMELGADPTAQTPAADVSAMATLGLVQVVTDPRTTVAQSLEALLTAELTDVACWELLSELARAEGHEAMAERFDGAAAAEVRHLDTVRRWLRELLMREAQ